MTDSRRTAALVLVDLWLAVIPGEGERAPSAGMVDLLTAKLSKQKPLALVERNNKGTTSR